MNETIAQLRARRSVRAYTDEPVSAADERAILEAACQAPTAGNQQLYSIIVVRDQSEKDELAITCDSQPFIASAPLVLAFCADVRRWHRAFLAAGADAREPGVGDLMLAVEDTMIAAQNAVTAAESLGLGSCYIGDILERREDQARILRVPAPRRAGLAARDRAPHRGAARPREARTAAALRHCVRGPLRGARRRAAARGPASQGACRPRSCRMGARVLRAQVELGLLSRDDALGGRDSLRLCDGRLLGPGSRHYLGTFLEVGKVALGGWHFLTCGFTGASAVYTLGCSEKVPR